MCTVQGGELNITVSWTLWGIAGGRYGLHCPYYALPIIGPSGVSIQTPEFACTGLINYLA